MWTHRPYAPVQAWHAFLNQLPMKRILHVSHELPETVIPKVDDETPSHLEPRDAQANRATVVA